MSQLPDDGLRRCPMCGRPEVDELLDDVEQSFDAFFDDAASQQLRIHLDEPEAGLQPPVTVAAAELLELASVLTALREALNLLRANDAIHSETDLRAMLDGLKDEIGHWAHWAASRCNQPEGPDV